MANKIGIYPPPLMLNKLHMRYNLILQRNEDEDEDENKDKAYYVSLNTAAIFSGSLTLLFRRNHPQTGRKQQKSKVIAEQI